MSRTIRKHPILSVRKQVPKPGYIIESDKYSIKKQRQQERRDIEYHLSILNQQIDDELECDICGKPVEDDFYTGECICDECCGIYKE